VATAAPTAELPSAADAHALLDGDGDGCVTEAELRVAAEARDIVLTEEQVEAFMALEADGDCVGLEAFLNSLDGSVEGDISDDFDDCLAEEFAATGGASLKCDFEFFRFV